MATRMSCERNAESMVKSWLYSRLKHVIARWVGFIYEIPMNTYSMPK